MSAIHTTNDVANALGVSPRRVQALAVELGLGTLLTGRFRVYTDEDVAAMRARKKVPGPARHTSTAP